MKEKDVDSFIKSQRTFFTNGPEYIKTKKALRNVILAMPDNDYKKATKNLIITCLHEGPFGQLMHMKPVKGKFKIMQLTVPGNMPITVLKYVIAHELGHAMQGRNWKVGDDSKLELNADELAKKWGFPKTKIFIDYAKKYHKKLLYKRRQ